MACLLTTWKVEVIIPFKRFQRVNLEIVLKSVPTLYSGNCYLMEFNKYSNWNDQVSDIYVGVHPNMAQQDIPNEFVVYFTQKNGWHGIVLEEWEGYQRPLRIDTSHRNFPIQIGKSNYYTANFLVVEDRTIRRVPFSVLTQEVVCTRDCSILQRY